MAIKKKKPAKKPVKKKTTKKPVKKKPVKKVRDFRGANAKWVKEALATDELTEENFYAVLAKRYSFSVLGGIPPRYTPDELLRKAQEYFDTYERLPLREYKVFGTGLEAKIPKLRAMTIKSFLVFACLSTSTWDDYRKDKRYSEVTKVIETIIWQQKFEGAAADLLNQNIIARDLGLIDKSALTDEEGKVIKINYIVPTQPKKEIEDTED